MAIHLPDARSLGDEVLEAFRLRALHARELGFTEGDIADLLGLSRETISRWWSAYAQGGLDGLPHDRTGRPLGSGRWLTEAQALHLQRLLDGQTPAQCGIAATLWTRRTVQELIRRECDLTIPLRTVGEYLRRWGYSPQRPRRQAKKQDPDEVREWLETTYPAIERRARRVGGRLHWCDEVGVEANHTAGRSYARVGQTPTVKVSGERFRVNQVSSISTCGQVHDLRYTSTLTGSVFLGFVQGLVARKRKKVFLILDRHPAHEAKVVTDWAQAHPQRIELCWLPRRAPELNPTEYLNNDLKSQVNAKRMPDSSPELEANMQGFMTKLKKLLAHVRSYFQHPKVQYAAAIIV